MATSVPVDQKATAFRELATQIDAGVGLYEALGRQQTRPWNYTFLQFFEDAVDHVGKGNKLSGIMRQHSHLFSEITIALVDAGEDSGQLDDIFDDIAEYLEREVELRNTIARETIYPKILVTAAVFIPLFAKVIVAWLSQNLLVAIGVLWKGLLLYAVIGGLPLLLLYLLYRAVAASEGGKDRIDRLKLSLPGFGSIVEQLALAKFARAYAALWEAGMGPTNAIPLSADACGNRHINGIFREGVPRVQQGKPLSETLQGTRLQDTLLAQLLETGEQTGNVDEMMTKAADHYEDEARTSIHKFVMALVPAVIIIMGVIVLYIAVSFYRSYATALMQ